jgi:hypothetical protein
MEKCIQEEMMNDEMELQLFMLMMRNCLGKFGENFKLLIALITL